ncbi:uncharacterized protein LOC132729631 [Ruditapes philippinarum]|uniref:uncharacterized protein LOC132729631 n=1 Tax=Ruditapes philippinarum TaxID=129788 RepID=UPI00295AA16A|nr:uncharacterized protein LOC132729631 [Ruditapes philippinarum]
MFSPEKSVRESSIAKLKFISGAQVYLGVGIFVCAVIAVTKQNDYLHFLRYYFIGGFTCGITGALTGIGGIMTVYKASSYNGDDVVYLRKEVKCTACLQTVFGCIFVIMAIPGMLMNTVFLVQSNVDDEYNDEHKTHVILSACILSGIVLLLLITILSLKTMGYQGNNQRMYHANYPNTVGGPQNYQGQSPYAQQQVSTTGVYNPGSNSPPYAPAPPFFGIGQNPTQYGVQPTFVPTAPPQPYSY